MKESRYIEPTAMIQSDHPRIVALVNELTAGISDAGRKAVKLFYFVRDSIWYDPYYPFHRPEFYRASRILADRRGYCVSKAVLLCALSRAAGIPSRLAFADVKNHLATRQLLEHMGSDRFVFHGYNQFWLDGRWVSAAATFNRELCARHRVDPLDFDGRHDAVLQPYNRDRQQFMEYLCYHGSFADVPLEKILAAWQKAYGRERVSRWIRWHDQAGTGSIRDFFKEDVVGSYAEDRHSRR